MSFLQPSLHRNRIVITVGNSTLRNIDKIIYYLFGPAQFESFLAFFISIFFTKKRIRILLKRYLKGLSRSTSPPVRLMMSELRGLSSSRVFFTYTGLLLLATHHTVILAIYAPMIYTAPCVMFLMCADRYITRASGRGLGPGKEIDSFLGPVIR